jgi:hypothetical protein
MSTIPIKVPTIDTEKQSPTTTSSFSNAYNSRALLYFHSKPKFRFWLKSFNIPGFNTTLENIDYQPSPIKLPGTDFIYNDLTTEFHLDEDFIVYGTLYNIIFGGMPGENFVCPRTNGTIIILDNSQREVVADFTFYDLQATGQQDLQYETSGTTVLTSQITFGYTHYKPNFYKLLA